MSEVFQNVYITKVADLRQDKSQMFYPLAQEIKTEQGGSSLALLLRFILYRIINSSVEGFDLCVAD